MSSPETKLKLEVSLKMRGAGGTLLPAKNEVCTMEREEKCDIVIFKFCVVIESETYILYSHIRVDSDLIVDWMKLK